MPNNTPTMKSIFDGVNPNDPKSFGMILARFDAALLASQQQIASNQQHSSRSMDDLRTDIRHLATSIESLKPLAERSVSIGDSISRIWRRIEAMEQQRDSDMDALHTRVTMTRSKLDKIAYVAIGISIASSLFSGIVYRLFETNSAYREARINAVDRRGSEHDNRIDRVEIHMAGDPDRPYRR